MENEKHRINIPEGTMRPVVSVIIPAYNAERFLSRAIDSAIGQTLPPLEIIVVDDGSSDGTRDVVASYGSTVRYIWQDNAGAATARNVGVSHAHGEVLAFLDADDKWHPRKLECQVPLLYRWPTAAFCTCRLRTTSDDQDLSEVQVGTAIDVTVIRDFRHVFRDPYFGTPTVVMRKEVFEACSGFDESLVTAEDLDLWMRAAYRRAVIMVEETLVDAFRYPGSLSSRGSFLGNLIAIDRFCSGHPDFASRHRRLVAHMQAAVYTAWASNEIVDGKKSEARHLLIEGLKRRVTVRGLYLLAKTLLGPMVSSPKPSRV